MGGDDTLTTELEQTHVTSAKQEGDTVENAQNVDDKSSRGENLQNLSNVVHGNDVNNLKKSEEKYFLLCKRKLLNSTLDKFRNRKYKFFYKLPSKNAVFGSWQKSFNVEYTPSEHRLVIELPVKFMKPTDLHEVDEKIPSGTMSEDASVLEEAYKAAVSRGWSEKHEFNLDAKNPESNGLYYDWSCVNPVHVYVSVRRSSASSSYKIYYYKGSPPEFRDTTWYDRVIFSENTLDRENDETRREREQNVFAHEFGHQIGLDDEYAFDYIKKEIRAGEEICVYKDADLHHHKLKAYERTEDVRQYVLPREKSLFNHEGKDYSAEEMAFVVNEIDFSVDSEWITKEKKGVVLKERGRELREPLEGLLSPDPVSADDVNNRWHQSVYFFEDGKQKIELQVREKAGLREYNLKELSKHRTDGAVLYHNGKKYSVGRFTKGRRRNNNREVFYYLVNEDGSIKGNYLDGTVTSHTQMAAKEFGDEYAYKNATMYDRFENNSPGLEKNLMDVGNDVPSHYYIPFKKSMVRAIQAKYGFEPSPKAPNMEEDWKIE